MDPHRIWTPGSKLYDGGPYSIENMNQGPFSMGSIFYDILNVVIFNSNNHLSASCVDGSKQWMG